METTFDFAMATKIALISVTLFMILTFLIAPDLSKKQRVALLACGFALSCMLAVGIVGLVELIREERAMIRHHL